MTTPTENPLLPFVRLHGRIVLDGGLATALEARGHDLNDDLWSAKVLMEDPDAIRQVHLDFLRAGADCITTATYQATFAGFSASGVSDEDAVKLLVRSIDLAVETRDSFWANPENRYGRLRPLVAASIGPYGAFLADGSEYTGNYGIDAAELHAFHERRWHILAESRADLLACETIPSRLEAEVLLRLLRDTPHRWAWMSFSCRDGGHVSDGSRLEHVALTEHTRSAARIEARYVTADGATISARFRLKRGGIFLETEPGVGAGRLRVEAPGSYVVLPDFFADDILIDASKVPVPEIEIPSENFLLHLIPGGDAIAMCVFENREQDVKITLAERDGRRIITGSDINFGKGRKTLQAVGPDLS